MLTTANGYVQTTTAPHLRGRVLALYMAVIMGSTPIGAPIAGWVATTFGARAAIQLGAAAGIIACVIGAVWLVTSGRLHRSEERRFALTIDETRPISVVAAMAPEEFSDEIAQTTPIPITDREAPLCPTASETAVSPTSTTKRRAAGRPGM
jgi:MFS family permease